MGRDRPRIPWATHPRAGSNDGKGRPAAGAPFQALAFDYGRQGSPIAPNGVSQDC